MNRLHAGRAVVLLAAFLIPILGCDGAGDVGPPPGSQGGPCYGNGTCDAGLVCTADGLCESGTADPCQGVACSDHGNCAAANGNAICVCDSGYHAEGLDCVEGPSLQKPFCETESVVYCNSLEGANPPDADPTLFLMDPYSSGRQTTTYLAQGYANPRILGTGALRFTMHDGGEDDTGVSFREGAPVNLPGQLNVGFVFRLGPNYLAPNLEGAKFVMAYGTNSARGWRPTAFLQYVTDTEGRVGAPGSRYFVLTAADDAAGNVADEFGYNFPSEAYAAGMTHTFRLDDYVGQWIYVEWEVRAQGAHRLYVATPDGAFRGAAPLAEIASAIEAASLPWTVGRANAYSEAMAGTTADSYVDVDLLRLNDSYMGPPAGFFD